MTPLIPLAAALLAATPYVRTRTEKRVENDYTAHCLFWEEPQLTFQQSTLGYTGNDQGTSDPDAEYTAIAKSFQHWDDVALGCGNFRLVEGPRTADRKLGFDASSTTNKNVILFRSQTCKAVAPAGDPCFAGAPGACTSKYDCWDNDDYGSSTIAITTVSYDLVTGRIYDADVEFNQSKFYFTTVDSPVCAPGVQDQSCISTDLENTMTHEAGHFLGLAHSPDASSTMAASATAGEISKRSLDLGSQQFVCDVYPKGFPSHDCGLPVVQASIGEKAAGCGVVPLAPSLVPLLGLLGLARRRRRGGA